jgi:predicted MFS family arabinose efflux permease
VILTIITYGVTCLIILKPINRLVGRIGVKRTFFLHIVASVIMLTIALNISVQHKYLFFLWQFTNAFAIMLYRIPLNAYFSKFGNVKTRGKEFSYTLIVQNLAAMVAAIVLGELIDRTGLHIYLWISTGLTVIAALVLWGKDEDDKKIHIDTRTRRQDIPVRIRRAYFYSRLPYAFNNDFLVIWITVAVGKFALAGIYFAMTILAQMTVSYIAGYYSDRGKVKTIFYLAVAVTSVLWLFVPFVKNAFDIFILQFVIGIGNLVVETPVEREYYNLAKVSDHELSFAFIREQSIQSGLVIGGIITLVAVSLIKQWHYLLVLGALYPLALTLMFKNYRSGEQRGYAPTLSPEPTK